MSAQEPREPRVFWINENKFEDTLGLEYAAKDNEYRAFKGTKVVEFTAYESLQSKLAIAEKALEFYAEKTNWESIENMAAIIDSDQELSDYKNQLGAKLFGGKFAREALEQIKQIKGSK